MATRRLWVVPTFTLWLLASAPGCGGGDGNGRPAVTPATPTRTPTRTLRPGEPTFTPTRTIPPPSPTPTLTPVAVVPGSRGIVESVRLAPPGAVVAVPAGVYAPFRLAASDLNGPVTLVADVRGQMTGLPAGEVVIQASGAATAITLDGVTNVTLDGFTVRGASRAGLELRESRSVTLQNLVVRQNTRDGIRLLRSNDVRLWNNLIVQNAGTGIAVFGSSNVNIANNTFYANRSYGLALGEPTLPATNVVLRNNIFVANLPRGIFADPSTSGIDSDYNLNRDGALNVTSGPHDLDVDPFWLDPRNPDGLRIPGTNDDCLGGSPIMDAGDPNIDPALVAVLAQRTTQTDNKPDCIGAGCCPPGCVPGSANDCAKIGAPDLGYHYPIR